MSNPLKSRGISSSCNRNNNGGPCAQGHPEDPGMSLCGPFGSCMDRWNTAICKCGGSLISPDCYNSIEPISLMDGGFVEFKISEKHRRTQLLDHLYKSTNTWNDEGLFYDSFNDRNRTLQLNFDTQITYKVLSLMFRTTKPDGMILYAATNNYFTLVELKNGKIYYTSKQNVQINMTLSRSIFLADGKWHNITLYSNGKVANIILDGKIYGDELDSSSIHDFLDPYLTVLSVGGARREKFPQDFTLNMYDGCLANFTINNEIQPFNGSGSIFNELLHRGNVFLSCHRYNDIESPVADPLSIGITLVIIFFVILLVAIFASFLIFRMRKQQKEKHGGKTSFHGNKSGTSTLLGGAGLVSSSGSVDMGRNIHVNDLSGVAYHSENSDILRSTHHIVGPEILSKKYKEREMCNNEPQRAQRPDIIEREVVSKSPPPLREEHHPPLPPPSQSIHAHDHLGNLDQGSEFPEHYDLENASSIAPSDIDIVYHYKGYREAGNARRKYKATPPPVSSYTHHKHQSAAAQHRHSPHHAGSYTPQPRIPPQSSQTSAANTNRPHQSTPLARLSPSSELSSQQPRILTLHDISGKPLQSALLATTSSSGGVGKDVLHSNSERSLNSPVMSQLSGQSSSASRKNSNVPPKSNVQSVPMGLTAEEIERLNARPRTSSLVSTLDAVSSSSEAQRVSGHQLPHLRHSPVADTHSSTSSDESGNDSFTCSEIEYDNNSINGDKYEKNEERNTNDLNSEPNNANSAKPLIPPPAYDGFESSFRGSLSTLVASDDDLTTHLGGMYRPNGTASPSTSTLGWDYLLNWGPNFESLMGVFKDIAELPDSVNVNGRVIPTSLRIPSSVQNPSEEYV